MEMLGFWTAVTYNSQKTTCSERMLERVDSLLNFSFLGCETVKVIEPGKVVSVSNPSSWLATAGKVILLCTGIIPLLLLITKAVLRSIHTFTRVDKPKLLPVNTTVIISLPPPSTNDLSVRSDRNKPLATGDSNTPVRQKLEPKFNEVADLVQSNTSAQVDGNSDTLNNPQPNDTTDAAPTHRTSQLIHPKKPIEVDVTTLNLDLKQTRIRLVSPPGKQKTVLKQPCDLKEAANLVIGKINQQIINGCNEIVLSSEDREIYIFFHTLPPNQITWISSILTALASANHISQPRFIQEEQHKKYLFDV